MPIFWRDFSQKWVLNFEKSLCASIEMITWFSFFSLLMWCITLIDLKIPKNSCIPGKNPTWSWCMILLMYCWIWFASILCICLYVILCICLYVILTYNFVFFVNIFIWFWCQGDGDLMEWIWECSFLCNFLE